MMDGNMMGGGSMMGSASQADLGTYMEMFQRHNAIRRRVDLIPGGIRTVTESEDPHIAALLKAHVSAMYRHVAAGQEVRCMSSSLPVMFRNAGKYRRTLRITKIGVAVTETSNDPVLVNVIRDHAREVSGFVNEGMPAMMRGMMR